MQKFRETGGIKTHTLLNKALEIHVKPVLAQMLLFGRLALSVTVCLISFFAADNFRDQRMIKESRLDYLALCCVLRNDFN